MKSNQNFNALDEIPYDQAIFSDKLYRKICNLDDTYSVFCLEFKNDNFIWEKIKNFKLPEAYECISFDNLVYVKENNTHITIYNTQDNLATKLMIYTGNNMLIWDILNIPFDINNLNTHSLLNLPTHINLINEYTEECPDENFDLLDDLEPITSEPITSETIQFEPLHGWSSLLERSSDTEEVVDLDNDLENDIEIKDNFVYPEDEYHTEMNSNDLQNNEEYRRDPYDGIWYSHSEFIYYYGGEAEWDFMESKKVLLREEYYKFTNTFCHLSDKKFKFLFREFKKTY
jgi:hypothetical protein